MDLKQLSFFVAVAEELHFAKAAVRCHTTQSVISRQLKRLEDEVGVELLTRTTRDVRLTRSGGLFLRDARRVLRHADRARASAASAAGGGSGRLSIGFTPASGSALIPTVVRSFREAMPGVAVDLVEMGSPDLETALNEELLDCAILHPSGNACALRATLLGYEPMLAVLSPGHRLARKRAINARDLEGQDLVFYRRERAGRLFDDFVDLLRKAGVTPPPLIPCSTFGSAMTAAASAIGIAFLPRSLCVQPKEPVRFASFANGSLRLAHVFATREEDANDKMIRCFQACVLGHCDALEPP